MSLTNNRRGLLFPPSWYAGEPYEPEGWWREHEEPADEEQDAPPVSLPREDFETPEAA